jgi:hypothetical protein
MSADDDDAADRAFELRARAELQRGVDGTPPELRAKLDRLVDAALNQPRKPRMIRFALPAAAVALVAGVLVTQPWRGTGAAAASPSEDFALLLNADLDMLEQMEFYQWLQQHPGVLEDAAASGSAQRS